MQHDPIWDFVKNFTLLIRTCILQIWDGTFPHLLSAKAPHFQTAATSCEYELCICMRNCLTKALQERIFPFKKFIP